MTAVTLSTGRTLDLREPTAGELRGLKLLNVLQLDTAAHAVLLPRISEMSPIEFFALNARDTMALMTAIVNFFEPTAVEEDPNWSPSA